VGGDEQLSFGGGGEVTNPLSRPKKGEGPQKRGPEGLDRSSEGEELEELKEEGLD